MVWDRVQVIGIEIREFCSISKLISGTVVSVNG